MIRKIFLLCQSMFFNSFSKNTFVPSLKLLCFGFLFTVSSVSATSYYTVNNGSVNDLNNWWTNRDATGVHPANFTNAADVFIIQNATSMNISAAWNVAGNLEIEAGGSLTLGNFTSTISGTTSISGTITHSHTVNLIRWFVGQVTVNAGGTWVNASGLQIVFKGGITNNGTFTAGTGTCFFSDNDQVLNGIFNLASLDIRDIEVTNNGSLRVTSNVSSNNAGKLKNSVTGTLTLTGGNCFLKNINNAGTIIKSGNTSFTRPFAENFINTGTVTLNGTGSLEGITNSEGGTVVLNSSGTIGTFNNAAATSILIINAVTLPTIDTLNATETGNTVIYNANAAQVAKSTTYSNLTLSGAGVKTLTGVTVNGVLSMGGTATASTAPTYGTLAALEYNTASNRTAGPEWVTPFTGSGGVTIKNTGQIRLNQAKIFDTFVPLIINPNAVLITANNALTFGGNFTNNGTFNAGSSLITVNGNAVQSISGFTTTGDIFVTKTGNMATFAGTVSVNNFTVSSGPILNLGNGLIHTAAGILTLVDTGSGTAAGSWGGTGSVATNINPTYFAAATGILNVSRSWCSQTIWDGTVWSNGEPDRLKNVIFAAPFSIISDLNMCSCTLDPGVVMTVPSDITLNIINSLNVAATASLTFENNSSLVQVTSNIVNTGNIRYKRNTVPVRRFDYTYWSSPVFSSSNTLHNLSPDTLGDKYYSFNPNSGWVLDYNGTLVMAPGIGYIVRAPQTFDITTPAVYPALFVGVPNNGEISIIPVAGKSHLIGNPYPSAIDANIFINANTNVGALYLWTHNTPPSDSTPGDYKYNYTSDDYAAYTLTGGVVTNANYVVPTGMVASGQSFFIKASTDSPIMFTNDMRVSGNNTQFYKTSQQNSEKNRLWLNFTNTQGGFKQLLIGYLDGATNSWDMKYDALTHNGNSFIDFYSINEASKLTIQGRALPFEDTDVIALGYKTSIKGDFTIAIDHVDGIFKDQIVFLEDKKMDKMVNLKTSNYTFATEIGTFTDRFALHYTDKSLGNDDFKNVENGLLVSVKGKTIKVTSLRENIKEVTIFDISGKLLYEKKKTGTTELQIQNLPSTDQVLLVKVTLENNFTIIKKIIF